MFSPLTELQLHMSPSVLSVKRWISKSYSPCRTFPKNSGQLNYSVVRFSKALLANYGCKLHWTLLVTTELATIDVFGKRTPGQTRDSWTTITKYKNRVTLRDQFSLLPSCLLACLLLTYRLFISTYKAHIQHDHITSLSLIPEHN